MKSLEASVAQAQEALRLERQKYQAGRSEINFVLDTEAAFEIIIRQKTVSARRRR